MIVLYGAGTTGRVIVRRLKEQDKPLPVLVDSDTSKHGTMMEGVEVIAPAVAQQLYPDATWIASAIIPEYHKQICEEIERMGVKTIPVWGFLPQRTTPPPHNVALELLAMVADDKESYEELCDQIDLRRNPQTHQQRPPSDIKEIYFPEFIARWKGEVFIDCGAADGDTIAEFQKRWDTWRHIVAFEPDQRNYNALWKNTGSPEGKITHLRFAVSDYDGDSGFTATGDYSAHLGEGAKVRVCKLDQILGDIVPTYIKMDIEGSELAALWGARRILKEHSPVLAICAYHESSHLWEIPLLIHALQPEYELFFRRYAQGSFEIVWYAVPHERLKR